ncbi:MAG: hypothetical protein JKY27_11280 [Magnetovibrio sp.]|nr:hypothetical protein [Magnetovibrio sp.]
MTTHIELAANLLRNAAVFFRDIGAQNPDLREQMAVNARTYDAVAEMVEKNPDGAMPVSDGGVSPPPIDGIPS